jgi:hypothetical protein
VTKPDPLRPLGLALVVGVVLLQVPYGGYAIYPFKLLGTWLHESCHALAMLLTGAGFTGLEVFADGSGLAHAERSAGPLAKAVIAPAGYMGAPLAGVAMVVAVSRRWARAGLIALGVALVATALASISNQFGQVGIGATGLALLAIAALPRPRWHAGGPGAPRRPGHHGRPGRHPRVVPADARGRRPGRAQLRRAPDGPRHVRHRRHLGGVAVGRDLAGVVDRGLVLGLAAAAAGRAQRSTASRTVSATCRRPAAASVTTSRSAATPRATR